MSTSVYRTPKSGRQSQFFQDLTTPVSSLRSEGKFTTPGQAAAVSALRRESSSWWSPVKIVSNTEQDDKGKGSPVEGVIQPGALITLPPHREVARPEMKKSLVPMENIDEEEWVTVYGFSPADTNLVLREFEKCGVILKHVHGPREANWRSLSFRAFICIKCSGVHRSLGVHITKFKFHWCTWEDADSRSISVSNELSHTLILKLQPDGLEILSLNVLRQIPIFGSFCCN